MEYIWVKRLPREKAPPAWGVMIFFSCVKTFARKELAVQHALTLMTDAEKERFNETNS